MRRSCRAFALGRLVMVGTMFGAPSDKVKRILGRCVIANTVNYDANDLRVKSAQSLTLEPGRSGRSGRRWIGGW